MIASPPETLFADRRQKIETLAVSPDGQWLIAGTRQGLAFIWDLPNRTIRHCINIGNQHNLLRSNQHDGRQVRWVAFTEDSQTALITSLYGTVLVWSLLLEATTSVMQGYSPIASALLENHLIAAATKPDASIHPHVRIGNWKTGRQTRTITSPDWVNAIALNPQYNLFCTGHDKGDIKLWDWETGDYLTSYQHPCWVHALLLHPEKPMLVSAGGGFIQDYTIQLWDCQTGAVIGILAGHDGNINCMALSPDGRTIATGSNDCQIKLWDWQTQGELGRLSGHWQNVSAVSFTPDGRELVSGGHDGTVRIWRLVG